MRYYDTIGRTYNTSRNADARITAALTDLLNLPIGAIVADIGAGTGNYANAIADRGYNVRAVEPSPTMRNQATAHPAVEWLAGSAESIPLGDNSVNGVISTLASHHFSSMPTAAAEMQRICPDGPVVLLTIDPRRSEEFWFKEYFPEIYRTSFDVFPPISEIADLFEDICGRHAVVHPFPLPNDLSDLNMNAGWNRPELYLDDTIRYGMSGFALGDANEVTEGISRLHSDLASGAWDERHGDLRAKRFYDLGFVFVRLGN